MFHLAYHTQKIKDETPVSVFERVRSDYAVLLQSGKEERYSFIGYQPFLMMTSKDDVQHVSAFHYLKDEVVADVQMLTCDTLGLLQGFMDQMKIAKVPKDLPPFVGGAMGFMSYEFGLKMQGIIPMNADDVDAPDAHYCFYDKVVAFDHEKKLLYFFGVAESKAKAQKLAKEVQYEATEGLGEYVSDFAGVRSSKNPPKDFDVFLDRETYVQKISKIKQHLKKGETYQVNFSYRFGFETEEDPFEIYKRMVELNPSPSACYFDFPEMRVMSCSPERLVSLQGDALVTRPIKGTRPRGKDASEDKKMEGELLSSKKDEAELSMIVDLMRNDFGKICVPKSVKVMNHREIQKYSHVMHTVSTVVGKLKKGLSFADVIAATFPGGSVTGCPKKRTMEIIHDLEEFHRDVYCGSAGYLSMSGNMDLNILIRTLLWKEGTVHFHSGGGIVMDSDAQQEFEETLHKAQILINALIPKL
ncbi:MAG: aminodeoxychorismate synthase component I [Patescibacteria group bacterium]